MATTLIAAVTRPLYNRNVTHRIVMVRGGVRRTVVMAVAAQRVNARMPVVRRPVVMAKPVGHKVAYARPVVKIRNR